MIFNDMKLRCCDMSTIDFDFINRLVVIVCFYEAYPLNCQHATTDAAEYCVFIIQPRCRGQCDKELTAITVRSAVCHR